MPNPTGTDLYVDVPLTNISIAYTQNAADFVSAGTFPNVPVQQQSGLFYKYDRRDWWRSEARVRAPGTESAGGGWRVTTDSYFADVVAIHKDIDDQDRANATPLTNLDRNAAQWVTQQLLLKRDKDWADAYFKAGVWGVDVTGVAGTPGASQFKQWDQAGSTPINDLRKQIIYQRRTTGLTPNLLVLGAEVWNVLQDHADFIERIKYSERAIVGPELLAAVLNIPRVAIANTVEYTGAEGLAEDMANYQFIQGKNALLVYAAPNAGLETPSAGYTFSWTGYLAAGPDGQRIVSFRDQKIRSDRVEGEMAYSMKVVSPELGVFFATAVA